MKLQEFSFGNFRSFKDINTLNLAPAKIKSKNPSLDENNIIDHEKQAFLKSKAIYGANASGKSNIIKAMVIFLNIVEKSVSNNKVLDMVDPFLLSTETEKDSTFFQMIFWIEDVKYRYGFEVDKEEVLAEWLFGTPNIRELPYFIREKGDIIKIDKTNFKEGYKFRSLLADQGNEIFRKNSLFLSTLASFGFSKLSKKLINEITSIQVINGLQSSVFHNYAKDLLENKDEKAYILNLLKIADIGIEDIVDYDFPINKIPKEADENIRSALNDSKFLISSRKKFDKNKAIIGFQPMMFEEDESEGTKKLFELSPFIYSTFKEKTILFIDEFDARFHPLLTCKIVELFNSKENKESQLVFTTHDTNLLNADLLRRDQIDFVEKDKYGSSHIYSLVEFNGTRKDNLFEKNYIEGKYGAIPFLGDFKELIK